MATSKAKSVSEYLRELDPERRAILTKVRKIVNENLPEGYKEGFGYGMVSWHIPLSTHRGTSNGQPLSYVALAAQKHYNALYLMGIYIDPANAKYLQDEFKKRGLKLDMGKSCLRFKQLDDLPLDVIATVISRTRPEALMSAYDASHQPRAGGGAEGTEGRRRSRTEARRSPR
jgi:hypothetical protein